jgi:hypothetical protein
MFKILKLITQSAKPSKDIYKLNSYLTGNTLSLRHKTQPINAFGETVEVEVEVEAEV